MVSQDPLEMAFRSDVTAYMFSKMRRGEVIEYTSYGPLRDAIESYLISSVKDIARIITKSKDTEMTSRRRKHGEMIETLIDHYGYIEQSAQAILTYAANNLWRDS